MQVRTKEAGCGGLIRTTVPVVGNLIGVDDITAAAKRIAGHVLRTPAVVKRGRTDDQSG